jgi:hypothetical protein
MSWYSANPTWFAFSSANCVPLWEGTPRKPDVHTSITRSLAVVFQLLMRDVEYGLELATPSPDESDQITLLVPLMLGVSKQVS